MMRTIYKNEIHNLEFELIPLQELFDHVPKKWQWLIASIHHVDTQLREEDGKKHWRVQGYLDNKDLEDLLKQDNIFFSGPRRLALNNVCMEFSHNKLEIWSLSVPYVE